MQQIKEKKTPAKELFIYTITDTESTSPTDTHFQNQQDRFR